MTQKFKLHKNIDESAIIKFNAIDQKEQKNNIDEYSEIIIETICYETFVGPFCGERIIGDTRV